MINLNGLDGDYERTSKTFSYSDRLENKMIGWVMEYVDASPLTYELFLEDGEVVQTEVNPDLSMTIYIQYKL